MKSRKKIFIAAILLIACSVILGFCRCNYMKNIKNSFAKEETNKNEKEDKNIAPSSNSAENKKKYENSKEYEKDANTLSENTGANEQTTINVEGNTFIKNLDNYQNSEKDAVNGNNDRESEVIQKKEEQDTPFVPEDE